MVYRLARAMKLSKVANVPAAATVATSAGATQTIETAGLFSTCTTTSTDILAANEVIQGGGNGSNNNTSDGKIFRSKDDGNQSAITPDLLSKWRENFYSEPKNLLAQNVCSRVDPFDVCLSRKTLETTNHVFNYKVETEGKPVTNQRSSGRCWLFAALNCIRLPFMKNYNLDEFEFSQAFLFYWDKIERCNYFLNNIVKTAKRGEKVDGRLVSFLLLDPTSDGGQWHMLVNLITKHGLMPKKCFPESFSCESSIRMNAILKSKVSRLTAGSLVKKKKN